jgi:hypothetical protein
VSPARALALQEFLLGHLTMFPDSEVSVTAKPGGGVVKARLETEVEFEFKDYELELLKARIVIL